MRFGPFLFLLIGIALDARGADEWTLTTADFRSERIALSGIDDTGVTITAGGTRRRVDFDRMLQLDRIVATPAVAGKFVLILSGGERLGGEPRGLKDETLTWHTPSLGEMQVPLSRVRAIAQPKRLEQFSDQRRREDVITLVNGDSVHGIVTGISGKAISLQSQAQETTDVPLESIALVEFAAVGEAQAPAGAAERTLRVSLADATTIPAAVLYLNGDQLKMTLRDGTVRAVPIASVRSIEQINGPVVWLSSRPPRENINIPYLELSMPAQFDRSVSGAPLRFGERTFARGVGVHSYSKITWEIDPEYKAFRTQYAIDGQLPYADVTVRIKLDDRVVHEQADFRAGVLAPVVLLDLNGVTTITLEVDMGQTYDVQDRFNWIEPALLKNKPPPATNPSTSPASLPGS